MKRAHGAADLLHPGEDRHSVELVQLLPLGKPALASAGLIKPLEPDAKGRRWEKSRDVMMHALRHLYASMMINGGVDVYTLADRLRHADPAFTLGEYVHRVMGAGSKVRIAVRSAYTGAA
ncbi:tyrosine-type recombinase/integrase [Streptomyces liangshanensis]|uniref:tyrosine-type recombinase/integrase n=1 Tax=Streptomyces liangshanensis TaxID=2717324 RepID=UPI001FB9A370|nr:tyrosine-type recombinase/integrase [Streptomyces liangshanensis]